MGEGGSKYSDGWRVDVLEYEDGRGRQIRHWTWVDNDFPQSSRVWGVWTVKAVAREAGISEVRVRQLLGEGRFPRAFKFARAWLIPEDDVRAYFAHPDRRRKGEVRQGALPGVSE